MDLSPKWRFRLNRIQNRWQAWRASLRQTSQAVTAEQKMCPSCRALVARGMAECPYCGQRLKVFAASPAGRIASRALPDIPVTGWLILANLLMFVLEYAVGHRLLFTHLMSGPGNAAELRLGASLPLGYILASHQYWRWVTACFLHASLLHIGFNMWVLYDVGPMVESYFGGAKYLTLYLLTGIAGYIASSAYGYVSLGASGAILGLFGVLIAYGLRRGYDQLRNFILRWVMYIFILAFFIPGVDNAAHLGGLVCGFLLGMVVGDDPPLTESQVTRWNLIRWAMLGVVALSFYLMAVSPVRVV